MWVKVWAWDGYAKKIGECQISDKINIFQNGKCCFFLNVQAERAYGTEISPTSFVISFVILLYAISYNICI